MSENIAKAVMECPHKDECTGCGSLWGETEEVWGRELEHRPSPHIGGQLTDEYCIYVLGQNPGNELDTMKARAEDDESYLMMHDYELRTEYTVSEFVDDLSISWDYLVWENVVRCPTENNSMNDVLKENCSEWTAAQIATFQPDVLIAMGSHARDWVNDTLDIGIEFGGLVTTDRDYLCIPHYSYLMRMGEYDETVSVLRNDLQALIPEEVVR